MKISKTILLILAVIAGIHIAGIGIFYFNGKKEQAPPKLDKSSAGDADSKASKTPESQTTNQQTKKSQNPLLGTHYSYRDAIRGNLKTIPETSIIRAGIVVNIDNHQVLWAKEPREGYPIASMTKMMTLLLASEALENKPDLTFDTQVKISLAASKIGGSQVWLDPRETLSLGELMKSVAVKSANDSAYQVAEFINDGDVDGFIGMMNRRARNLLMPNTAFVNPHGLKSKDGRNSISCAEGMARLAEQLLEHPLIMNLCAIQKTGFRDKNARGHMILYNTNRLLGKCPGVDGLKTGFIQESGFCITVTCLRGGKRMIAVVMGSPSSARRNALVADLLDWSYRRDAELNDPTYHLDRESKSFGSQILKEVKQKKTVPMPKINPIPSARKQK
ncbi:MAG: D-alanyl-D-alanine carboxypeptidase [Victivallaceae bacterium]|nr:D-alanyl-D-alanine carboxypeptidase [Victivallaceae bacterium]